MQVFSALRHLFVTIVILGAWFCSAAPGWAAPARFALLIGNQTYPDKVGPLRNPHNDVETVAAALSKLGFEVTVVKDAGYKTVETALKTHIQNVRHAGPGAISLFYYSGHGAADPETHINYLIPVDVQSADDADLWTNSFELNDIVRKLRDQAPAATHFVIFDACREELRLTRQGKKALGAEKGFNAISSVAGVMIAYATAPGRTASDVGQDAGPYAKALASEIVRPGVEAVTMFRNVQLKVKETIGQDPWLSFPTLPPIYFATPVDSGARDRKVEEEFWETAKANGGAPLLSAYVARYPDGNHVAVARSMMQDVERKQAAEAAELAKAEQAARDLAVRLKAEQAELASKRAEDEAKRTREDAAKKMAAMVNSATASAGLGVDAAKLSEIETAAKQAKADAAKAEAQRQIAVKAAEEARARIQTAKLDADEHAAQPAERVSTLAQDIQNELKRLGCLAGKADAAWSANASKGLARYLAATKQEVPQGGLTADFLGKLKGTEKKACKSPCGPGESLSGDKCVVDQADAHPVAPRVVSRNGNSGGGSGGGSCAGKGWVCQSIRSAKGAN